MCRTSVIKRKSVRDQKTVNKKKKINREVCEGQPGDLASATIQLYLYLFRLISSLKSFYLTLKKRQGSPFSLILPSNCFSEKTILSST